MENTPMPPGEVESDPFPPPPQPKSPGLAFAVSLLLPGLGQLYCGKVKRSLWTLIPFVLVVVAAFFLLPSVFSNGGKDADLLAGVLLHVGLILYGFAFLDAFFTAREMSAGVDQHMLENPRVAAVLNLLTLGFGYWYVGERKKALVVFFFLGAANRAVRRLEDPALLGWASLILEVALIVIAVDAYRIAKKDFEERLEVVPLTAASISSQETLTAAVPLSLAGFFVLGYVVLVAVGSFLPDYSTIDQSRAVFRENPDRKAYLYPPYGIEFHLPAEWEFDRSDKDFIAEGIFMDGNCRVSLMAQVAFPWESMERAGDLLSEQLLSQEENFRLLEHKPTVLAGRPAHEVVVATEVEDTEVSQHYVVARRGMTRFVLIITTIGPFGEICHEDIAGIRGRLKLPR